MIQTKIKGNRFSVKQKYMEFESESFIEIPFVYHYYDISASMDLTNSIT